MVTALPPGSPAPSASPPLSRPPPSVRPPPPVSTSAMEITVTSIKCSSSETSNRLSALRHVLALSLRFGVRHQQRPLFLPSANHQRSAHHQPPATSHQPPFSSPLAASPPPPSTPRASTSNLELTANAASSKVCFVSNCALWSFLPVRLATRPVTLVSTSVQHSLCG